MTAVTTRPGALLTDLGGVLLLQDWSRAATHWESTLDLPAGRFLQALFGGSDDLLLIGRLDEERWWEVVADRLQITSSQMAEVRAGLARTEVLDSRLLAYCRSLRRRGLQLAIVSNAWSMTRCRLSRLGLLPDFDEVVISAEVGTAKPGPEIFRLAAERLGRAPMECIYVDDQDDCVAAASRLGMTAVKHVSPEKTAAAIDALLARKPASRLLSASRLPAGDSPAPARQ